MKKLIITTIVTLATIGAVSTSFSEPRTSRFLGVTYTVPETKYEDTSSGTVRKSDPIRSKFLGATVIVPERNLASAPVNEVRKHEPIRTKFLGVTEVVEQ